MASGLELLDKKSFRWQRANDSAVNADLLHDTETKGRWSDYVELSLTGRRSKCLGCGIGCGRGLRRRNTAHQRQRQQQRSGTVSHDGPLSPIQQSDGLKLTGLEPKAK